MEKYINRKEYISKLLSYKDKDLIKVVSGFRRSGKSTLLEIYFKHLLNEGIGQRQIQFYNFELPENYLNKTWSDIYFDITHIPESSIQLSVNEFVGILSLWTTSSISKF